MSTTNDGIFGGTFTSAQKSKGEIERQKPSPLVSNSTPKSAPMIARSIWPKGHHEMAMATREQDQTPSRVSVHAKDLFHIHCFYIEYVSKLQGRQKWRENKFQLKVDDLVLIDESNLSPLQWKLGRVTQLDPDSDGIPRVATPTLRTDKGDIRRAISNLCPLPPPHEVFPAEAVLKDHSFKERTRPDTVERRPSTTKFYTCLGNACPVDLT
ncbi:hypothetical protein JTB14_021682 [Gonioctena quinquepunctata]|nr:hypothetical protein JTB14_021682 [Gonioctena quinquepunctata]